MLNSSVSIARDCAATIMNVALNNISSVRIKVSDNESAAELWYIIMVLFDYEMVQCFVNCNDKRVFKPVATEALPLGVT